MIGTESWHNQRGIVHVNDPFFFHVISCFDYIVFFFLLSFVLVYLSV
jgi:hypothetical protein